MYIFSKKNLIKILKLFFIRPLALVENIRVSVFQIFKSMSEQGWVPPRPSAPPDYFTDSEGEGEGARGEGEGVPSRGVYLPPYLPSNRVRPAG